MSFNVYTPTDTSNPLTSPLHHVASMADLPYCQQLPANSIVFMDTPSGLQQIFDNRVGAVPPTDPNLAPDVGQDSDNVGDSVDSEVTGDTTGIGTP
jgi:hypothetical protein